MTVIQLPRWRSVSKRVGGVVYQSQDWNTQGGGVVYQKNLKGDVCIKRTLSYVQTMTDLGSQRSQDCLALHFNNLKRCGVSLGFNDDVSYSTSLSSFTKKMYCATMNWAERLLEVSIDWWSPGEESGEGGVFYWSRSNSMFLNKMLRCRQIWLILLLLEYDARCCPVIPRF